MAENRLNRDLEVRETKVRKRSWIRPETLPSPTPEDGYDFRWVRISSRGEADPMNVSLKLQEGWEPVKAADHPEIFISSIESERFKDNIVIGGLMLCKAPSELVEDRTGSFEDLTASQMRSVDQNFMRVNDPRMPLFNDRRSKVSFGSGS
jgi:hypothetical protein